jgi:hypothetical protein
VRVFTHVKLAAELFVEFVVGMSGRLLGSGALGSVRLTARSLRFIVSSPRRLLTFRIAAASATTLLAASALARRMAARRITIGVLLPLARRSNHALLIGCAIGA